MATLTAPPEKPATSKPPRSVKTTSRRGLTYYAPVVLAILLVVGLFVALSFVIATDDVAGMVEVIGLVGWGIAGTGLLLGLGVMIRRGKPLLGLGFISALVLLVVGIANIVAAPIFTGPAHYSQGQQAISNQKYEQAIAEYRMADDPAYLRKEVPETYLKWGDQLLKAGQFEQALARYEKILSPELRPNLLEGQIPDARARVYLAWADRLDKDNARGLAGLTAAQRAAFDTDLLSKYDAALALQPSQVYLNAARSGARNVLYRQAEDLKAQTKYEDLDALYKRIVVKYLDTSPQALAEVEVRQANNFWDWGRRLSNETDYEAALRYLREAETRFGSYDPRRLDNVLPDVINNYSKLAPQLITDGKYDEAVSRLEDALRIYGAKDPANSLSKALLNSYVEYGKDLEARPVLATARDKFKLAFDLDAKYKLNDTRPREGLGRVYLAQGQEAELKLDFAQAIAIYRDGLKLKYFSLSETSTATSNVSRTYFSWAQQFEQKADLDKALGVYREGLTTNGFEASAKNRATDAGGDIFLKQGAAAEQKPDLQGAINVYAALAADPQFKTSAASKNLVNIAPKVLYALADQNIKEAKLVPNVIDNAKLVKARELLQNIVGSYGTSELAKTARDILNAQIEVTGKILNSKGDPLGNRPVQFSTDWKFCTANTPDDDTDCRGRKEGIVPKGEVLGITTAPDGGWVVKLNPNKTYLVSWQERGGKVVSAFTSNQPQPGVQIKTDPMIPIKYEYRTPTEALP